MNNRRFLWSTGVMILAMGFAAPRLLSQEPISSEGTQHRVVEWEMKLRVLEGVREGTPASLAVVTSSFIKYAFSANFRSAEELAEEQGQIKRIFNLKDARLLTEGLLDWKIGNKEKVDFVFRLDGQEYLVRVRGGDLNAKLGTIATQSFGVEVFEQLAANDVAGAKIESQASLLDSEFTVSSMKNVTVFGFEDTKGKPYFISLRQTKMVADEAVVKQSGVSIGELVPAPEIKPPKRIFQVNPVYPEIARQAGVSGMVIIQATTDIYGRVVKVKVLKSIPLLDQAAMDAVRQWVYEPMMINGKPRAIMFVTSVAFTLVTDKDGKVRGYVGEEAGGVTGGVEGGVGGGVQGGVEGGVQGGVEGRVEGGVVSGVTGKGEEDFAKGAVKATGEIKPPRRIKIVDPVYPTVARQARVEGNVVLEARTDENGNVEDVKVIRSIPLLDQAAFDAVKQWKFEPKIIDGKPSKVVFDVTVKFMLSTGNREKDIEKFAQGAVRAVGDIKPPRRIKAVDPVYPEEARKAGVAGVVVLAAKTDGEGRVVDVMILKSIPLLDKAAIDAVRQWEYEPMIINNKPTPIAFVVTVIFQVK